MLLNWFNHLISNKPYYNLLKSRNPKRLKGSREKNLLLIKMKKILILMVLTVFVNQIILAQTPSTCCPPLKKSDIISNINRIDQSTAFTSPYKIEFKLPTTVKDKMIAYIKYINLLCPGKKFVIALEVGKVNSAGDPFVNTNRAICTSWYIFNTGNEPFGDYVLGSWCHPAQTSLNNSWLQRDQWYVLRFSIGQEPVPSCFSGTCVEDSSIWIRINSGIAAPIAAPNGAILPKASSSQNAVFEIHDGERIIKSTPVKN